MILSSNYVINVDNLIGYTLKHKYLEILFKSSIVVVIKLNYFLGNV